MIVTVTTATTVFEDGALSTPGSAPRRGPRADGTRSWFTRCGLRSSDRGRWRPAGGSGRTSAPWPLPPSPGGDALRTAFTADPDGCRVSAVVEQQGPWPARTCPAPATSNAAAAQASRALSLDVDARAWPSVGALDPVIGAAQALLPGLARARPLPRTRAVWAVLCQRTRITQAAALGATLVRGHGDDGVFPPPPCCTASRWTCGADRRSTCTPGPAPGWRGSWTERRCAPRTPTRRWPRSRRSTAWDPPPPSSSS